MVPIPMEEERSERIWELFDLLLDQKPLEEVLALEPDGSIRREVQELWKFHMQAESKGFLEGAVQFEVRPVFEAGQVVLNRFEILRSLGAGGMGEVYLAHDRLTQDHVALKTVARLLASSNTLRAQIISEVKNAQRVAHQNVCRIHALFEDGPTVFFTMEYVEGRLLSDVLVESGGRKLGRPVALQLAEGLHAAHRMGVIHGDFKPGNVMLTEGPEPRAVIMDFGLARALENAASPQDQGLSVRAGTVDYMAPELQGRVAPSVLSDIYAFGKVARQLMPGYRIWEDCAAEDPKQRPQDLERVIGWLGRGHTRRYLLGALGVAGTGALSYYLLGKPAAQEPPILQRGARLLVNGFVSAGDSRTARKVRASVLTGLQQSPLFRAIGDEDLPPAVKREGTAVPVNENTLLSLAEKLRVGYWVNSQFHEDGGRYSLLMELHRAGTEAPLAKIALRDLSSTGKAAEAAAYWLRHNLAGESEASLNANPPGVMSFTTKVPEALDKYYDGMAHFAVKEMDEALLKFEEALRLDPNFAQAHMMRSSVLKPKGRLEEAFQEAQLAADNSHGLPERERTRIEAFYFHNCEDHARMVATAMRNREYFLDEPRFDRILAVYLRLSGRAEEAVGYNRHALTLSNDELLTTELIYSLVESGQYETALNEYQNLVSKGIRYAYSHRLGGFAYLGLGRYREARACFEKNDEMPDKLLDTASARFMLGETEAVITSLRMLTGSLQGPDGSVNTGDRGLLEAALCGAHFLTDRLDTARNHLTGMIDIGAFPPCLPILSRAMFWAARLRDSQTAEKISRVVNSISDKWPSSFSQACALYCKAVMALLSGSAAQAEGMLLQAAGLEFNLWTFFELAEFYSTAGKYDIALDYWERVAKMEGYVLARAFAAELILYWGRRSIAANAAGHYDAATYSKKILELWGKKNPSLQIVKVAAAIQARSNNFVH